jgi:membrane-anchored protein YejM (alkaline phosphatase superfamily)
MLSEPIRVANAREHMSWSHRFALFWLALSLVIFGGAYLLAEASEMSETNRTLMFVMLGTIVVTNAVWQAAGLALARLENLILPRWKAPGNHD